MVLSFQVCTQDPSTKPSGGRSDDLENGRKVMANIVNTFVLFQTFRPAMSPVQALLSHSLGEIQPVAQQPGALISVDRKRKSTPVDVDASLVWCAPVKFRDCVETSISARFDDPLRDVD
jgi:hypothetical protein